MTTRKPTIKTVPGKVEPVSQSKFIAVYDNGGDILGPFNTKDAAAEEALSYWDEEDLPRISIYEVTAKFSIERSGFKFNQEEL